MKENRLFTLALAVSASVILLLSGIRILSDAERPRYQVSVVVDESASGRWLPFREGLLQAAKDNNIELNFVSTDTLVSVQQEGKIISREIQNGANGVIVAFRASEGTSEMLRGFTGQSLLELVDTEVESEGNDTIGTVTMDSAEIGRALRELLRTELRLRGDIKENRLRVGILSGNQQQFSMQEILSTFSEGIEEENVDISWEISGTEQTEEELRLKNRTNPVDILLSMDNHSTEQALHYLRESRKESVKLYGVGTSDELVYGLDSGLIAGLIVPEEFNMGYRALSDLAGRLNHRTANPIKRKIGFRMVSRDNMYLEENQRILFPRIE